MKVLLKADLIIVVHILVYASEADTGCYCIGKKQPWINATKACLDNGGKPLRYMIGLDNVLGKLLVNQSMERNISVWTTDYIELGGKTGPDSKELCAFRYKSGTSIITQKFYGDCNTNRSYLCRESVNSDWAIREGYYKQAINECSTTKVNELKNFSYTAGYYWVKDTLSVTLGVQYASDSTEHFKCGAYSVGAGLYFRSCADKILSLCHFASKPDAEYYEPCLTERKTPTFMSVQNTTVTKPVRVAGDKANDISTATASTGKSSRNSTEGNQQRHMNHVVAESTSSQIPTKRPKEDSHVKKNDEENDTDIGIKVGLPVGLCLALICGIILSFNLARRHKCWKKAEAENSNDNEKRSDNKKGLVCASQHNAAYGVSEDKHIKIIKHGEKDTELQYKVKKTIQNTEPTSVYAVVHKSKQRHENSKSTRQMANNGNKIGEIKISQKLGENTYSCPYGNDDNDNFAKSNVSHTAEYSVAKETEAGWYSTTEEDYDITSNVQRCIPNTSNSIYNKMQTDEYDSTINVRIENDCNQVYGKTEGAESEYDTTTQGNEPLPCDNVYNHLSQSDTRNDQNNYDSTFNISELRPVKVTDHTYGKLKVKSHV